MEELVYELGFHLAPSLSEDEVEKAVQEIKTAIEGGKGSVFAEESPKLTPLAYKIVLRSDAGTQGFDKAYFGWVKFVAPPENISKVNDFAKANKNIIRFILVKTDRANTTVFHKVVTRKEDASVDAEGKPVEQPEEIDAKIEELVV